MSYRTFRLTTFLVTVIEEITNKDGPSLDCELLKDQVKEVLPEASHVQTARTYFKDMNTNETAKQLIDWNYDPKDMDLKPIITWE